MPQCAQKGTRYSIRPENHASKKLPSSPPPVESEAMNDIVTELISEARQVPFWRWAVLAVVLSGLAIVLVGLFGSIRRRD